MIALSHHLITEPGTSAHTHTLTHIHTHYNTVKIPLTITRCQANAGAMLLDLPSLQNGEANKNLLFISKLVLDVLL